MNWFAFGEISQGAQFFDGPLRVEMAIAHGYLATRIAWVDDEQVFLGVTETRDTAQLDFARGLTVWDAYPSDVDQVEITATAMPIGITS